MLLWLLPPFPPAINAGVQLSLWIASSLGDSLKRMHTHGHMENINIITKSKQWVTSAATRPRVIQSEHPLTHSPKVIGLGGRVGATTLLGTADNWLINVQPTASESESTELRPCWPHEAPVTSGQWRRPTEEDTRCMCVCGKDLHRSICSCKPTQDQVAMKTQPTDFGAPLMFCSFTRTVSRTIELQFSPGSVPTQ